MRVFVYTIDLDKLGIDEVHICHVGDMHLGTKSSSRKKYLQAIQQIIDDPRKFMIGMGDYTDSITPTDKRYDPDVLDKEEFEFRDQRWQLGRLDGAHEWFEMSLEELAKMKKIIGLHVGNHGSKVYKQATYDSVKKICGRLRTKFLGDGVALWRLRLKRGKKLVREYKFCTDHGSGGGWTLGAAVNRQMRDLSSFDADAYVIGHTHRLICWPVAKVDTKVNPGSSVELVEEVSWLGESGSFYLTYKKDSTGYGERRKYSPLVRGYLTTVCKPDELYMVPRVL